MNAIDNVLNAASELTGSCIGRLPADSSDSVMVEVIRVMRLQKAILDYDAVPSVSLDSLLDQAQATEKRLRDALEGCRLYFDMIDTLHAVEGGDVRFIRKAKGHSWLARWEVVAALENRPLEDVIKEHVAERINDQLSDEVRGAK